MSDRTFLLILLGVQSGLLGLDLLDRRLTRGERYEGEPVRAGTLAFLLAVTAGFLVLQYGGLRLVPDSDALLERMRASMGGWLGPPGEAPRLAGGALPAVAVAAFYLAGLWDYLLHRFVSHSPWMWFTHEYHHLPNQVFVAMPGIAARPFAVVAIFPVLAATIASTYAGLALLGLPLWDLSPLKIVVLLQTSVGTASHSSFLRRFWAVHYGMRALRLTTPQEHLVHHSADLEGNYGNFTTLWDRAFGTYLDPTLGDNQNHPLGLPYDQDFLGTLTFGRYKLPEPVRQRFQVARYCNVHRPADRRGDGVRRDAGEDGRATEAIVR